MSNEDGNYAPKSPDLSSFLSSGPDFVQSSPAQPQSSSSGYSPFLAQPTEYQPQPHQAYQQAATYNDFVPSPYTPQSGRPQHYFPPQQMQYGQTPQSQYGLQSPSQPPSYWSYDTPDLPVNQYLPAVPPPQISQLQTPRLPIAHDKAVALEPAGTMPPRKAKAEPQPEIEPSPVKTKFPTARIKRIMQADEEVGKVAQQTPIAVGKALELFMVDIVRQGADVAKEKNSKRITAQMLKHAVEANPQWDFLQEIVSKVSEKEDTSRSSKAKAETESDEEADSGEAKKKATRGGRKMKTAT